MAETTTGPQVRATVRYLHTSPYKVRQVLELVRGLPVGDAERLLQLCEKDAADDMLKLLGSAIANAEHNNSHPGRRAVRRRAPGPTKARRASTASPGPAVVTSGSASAPRT